MKPVDQTTFGAPGGNCFSACIASLLELPIEEDSTEEITAETASIDDTVTPTEETE